MASKRKVISLSLPTDLIYEVDELVFKEREKQRERLKPVSRSEVVEMLLREALEKRK